MLARHEVPGKHASVDPSRRVRYDRRLQNPSGLHPTGRTQLSCAGVIISNRPLRDGSMAAAPFPRHFVPGYHQFVAPRQRLSARPL